MLTPKQIKNHEFQQAGRNAYKSADVDEFFEEVYESFEQLFKDNADLVKKVGLLADKVSEYKGDEDNIRNALLMAERMKESIVTEAQEKSREILAEAEEKVRAAKVAVSEKTAAIIENAEKEADKIVRDANERADDTLKLAQSNATKLLAKAQEIYDEQVNTVKDEAEKEREYLDKIKEESAKIRASLMDTYKMQLELLEFTPDFAADIAAMRKKKAAEDVEDTEIYEDAADTENAEEIENPVDTEETEEAEDTEAAETVENPEGVAEDVPETSKEVPNVDAYLTDETDNDAVEDADVDKYLNGSDIEFEDIDSGRSLFDEDEEEDLEDETYDPEQSLFDREED